MPKAVRFHEYGGIDVLRVEDVDRPVPGSGQVLVEVKAAGINPGESAIREGTFAEIWPTTFPSGQGSDFAGIVAQVGSEGTGFAAGDEVIGFVDTRASHAQFIIAEADNLIRRPPNVTWDEAGSLFVVGTTAYAAIHAVGVAKGDTVVVSGAAGGVGSITVQLAKIAGANVIGLASQSHHEWLIRHGVIPVTYGQGVTDRILAAANGKVDAFIDTFGDGYVELAIQIGVKADRINTIKDMAGAQQYKVKTAGNAQAAKPEVLAELADLISKGTLEIPIANAYPLDRVHDAFRELEQRHTLGKIVLKP